MTACERMRPLLLDAEPDALRGEGTSDVAVHVRACPACAARARTILDETQALDRFLGRAADALDVDEVLRAAGHPAADPAPATVVAFPSWRRWVPLVAAAAVAGLLLFRGDPSLPPPPPTPQLSATPPVVEAAPDRNVAVLATANPDITVVWFFD